MNLIVAVDDNWAIGNRGELLAHVRMDLRNFAKLTTGKTVVYGSKTLATFPGGKVLKNRNNIIMSTRRDFAPEGAVVCDSVESLLETLKAYNSDEVFVIGGASIYKQLLPYCDTAYVTKFCKSYEFDAQIPNLDEDKSWSLVYRSCEWMSDETLGDEPGLAFFFTKYRRKTL